MTLHRLRRFARRRQFYLQLPQIALAGLTRRARGRVFVALMGGVGDLVNAFPTLTRLGERATVDLGTGGGPYAALARRHPTLHRVYSPFVYKPIRRAHRRLIERTLAPFYERVILLDEPDSAWRTRTRHLSAVYAERCGCPAPAHGSVYLTDDDRRRAAAHLAGLGVERFVYVTQLIRPTRAARSWPLGHYHALCHALARHLELPILVDTVGSSETAVAEPCRPLTRLDIATAAAVIERASLYIGPDSGLTHVAAALGVSTVSIHLGHPPEICGALGDNVVLVRQARPGDDPALTSVDQVLDAVDRQLAVKP